MSEEQMRILKMLSEGKISVEQAEGLLEALAKAEPPAPGPAQEAMDKLSKVIGGVIENARGMAWGGGSGEAEEGGQEVGPEGLELPEDAEMILKIKGGSVHVRQVEGTRKAQFSTSSGARPKVRLDGRTCLVSVGPRTGEMDVSVPALGALAIRLMGGRADLAGVGAPIRANVKGGDLEATGCRGTVAVKCMGGTVHMTGALQDADVSCMGGSINLDGLLIDGGKHAVKMMGGDLRLSFRPGSSVRIQTSVLGGSVNCDLPCVSESGGHVKRRAEYLIGGGEGLLSVKLLGGDVTITEGEAAEEDAAEPVKENA
jgi:hypothetical protein